MNNEYRELCTLAEEAEKQSAFFKTHPDLFYAISRESDYTYSVGIADASTRTVRIFLTKEFSRVRKFFESQLEIKK